MKKTLLTCLAWMVVLTAPAQTQEPDSVVNLDEVIISANKVPEVRSKVAQQKLFVY